MLPLTDEQAAVVEAVRRGGDLQVRAFAGSGKTTTLEAVARDVASRRPGARCLYLTFSRRLRDEAERRFPETVTVLTNHAVAYREVGRPLAQRGKLRRGSLLANRVLLPDMLPRLRTDLLEWGYDGDSAACIVLETIQNFLHSADPDVGPQHVPEPVALLDREGRNGLAEAVADLARRAWGLLIDLGRPTYVNDDVYLKLYSLRKPRLPYDLILFDEAQDANPAMLDILLHQTHAQRVFVGDPHQQLYAWRGAVDAMEGLPWPVLALTQSFRFGEAIARLATDILRTFKGETRTIRGNPRVASRVGPLRGTPAAILARTNAGVIEALVELTDAGIPAVSAVPIGDLTRAWLAAYDLRCGRRPQWPEFAVFRSWKHLRELVERHPRIANQYGTYVGLVERYGDRTPAVCRVLESRIPDAGNDGAVPSGAVVVSTVHRAKGREWERVLLGGDFERIVLVGPDGTVLTEEVHVAYVAATRAREALDPGPLTDVLESGRRALRRARPPSGWAERLLRWLTGS